MEPYGHMLYMLSLQVLWDGGVSRPFEKSLQGPLVCTDNIRPIWGILFSLSRLDSLTKIQEDSLMKNALGMRSESAAFSFRWGITGKDSDRLCATACNRHQARSIAKRLISIWQYCLRFRKGSLRFVHLQKSSYCVGRAFIARTRRCFARPDTQRHFMKSFYRNAFHWRAFHRGAFHRSAFYRRAFHWKVSLQKSFCWNDSAKRL